MSKKIYLIIGIIIFILIIGSYFQITSSNSKSTNNTEKGNIENETEIGEIVYNGKFAMPIENFIQVTSKFGYREVTHSGWQNGYGNCVEIKHIDEQGNIFYTFYGHMRDNSLQVTKGQQVVVGQVIGIQGSTGNSTGDHLHFEVRKSSGTNKDTIDPAPYLFGEKERE